MLRFAVGIRYHERAVGVVQRRDAAAQDLDIETVLFMQIQKLMLFTIRFRFDKYKAQIAIDHDIRA